MGPDPFPLIPPRWALMCCGLLVLVAIVESEMATSKPGGQLLVACTLSTIALVWSFRLLRRETVFAFPFVCFAALELLLNSGPRAGLLPSLW